jgi:hypothetical protein
MTDPRYTRGSASRNVVQPQWIIWVGVAFFLAGVLVLVGFLGKTAVIWAKPLRENRLVRR